MRDAAQSVRGGNEDGQSARLHPHRQGAAKEEGLAVELKGPFAFDARGVAKRFRHAAIFGALDSLQPGETMRFCNDHDPLPLLSQINSHFGANVTIEYVQRNPGEIIIDFRVVG